MSDNYLFFDTETTGIPKNWKAPVTDLPNWPRMVQLAWLVYSPAGEKLAAYNYIIKPEGFIIPEEVVKVHGITTERALLEGVELQQVLNAFMADIASSAFLVAHNISFDEKIVGAEFLRKHLPNVLQHKKKICTMNGSVDFCAIKGPYGNKWPKLTELHTKLFGTGFEEAHNALIDIEATARCFWELRRRAVL